ncbi:MAG: GlsB/YeaQ/YmgE family stress response membrane protein [Pirellulales bacterium]
MLNILSWMLFGLVVGAISRLLYPGRQPMGIFATMVLGIIGSLVGGAISYAFGYDPMDGFLQGSGWIMSIIGSLIVVWTGLFVSSKSTTTMV